MEFTFKKENEHIGIYQLKGNLIGEKDGIPITESFSQQLEDGIHKFIIDLKELQHINSTGLGVMIRLLTKARRIGGEVALSSPSDYINNLLLITKLNSIFSIYEDQETAVTALSDPDPSVS